MKEVLNRSNIMTMTEIKKETDKVFDKMFSIEDVLKGNTIEMREEARKIAIANLKKKNK